MWVLYSGYVTAKSIRDIDNIRAAVIRVFILLKITGIREDNAAIEYRKKLPAGEATVMPRRRVITAIQTSVLADLLFIILTFIDTNPFRLIRQVE